MALMLKNMNDFETDLESKLEKSQCELYTEERIKDKH